MAKKTWKEKLDSSKPHYVKKLEKKFSDMEEGTMMLIANPKLVDDYIREIPLGVSVDMKTMRIDLGHQYGGDISCPVSTGIFLRTVAEAAYVDYETGASVESITPFWRIIHDKMPVAKKLTCGLDFLNNQRKLEGIY